MTKKVRNYSPLGIVSGPGGDDLEYLLTHPLTARIFQRKCQLANRASELPEGSAKWRNLTKRIAQLEAYGLPRPDGRDLQRTEPVYDDDGQKIGMRHSPRRRFLESRRGRPAVRTIQTRAALEIKLSDKNVIWRQLANKFNFPSARALERDVRRLKVILKREKIPLS
jgi:hypothetical protein